MKNIKFLLIGTALFLNCITLFSQDIIITKDAKTIKAKIIDITENSVRYVDMQYTDSLPIYTMLKSNIISIVYQNGKTETYIKDDTTLATTDNKPMVIDEKTFQDMEDQDMEVFLQQYENGDIYDRFHTGMNLRNTGNALLYSGITVAGVGVIGFVSCIVTNYFNSEIFIGSYIAVVVGEALLITSIPLNIIGATKKRTAKNDYIEHYIHQAKTSFMPTLQIKGTQYGIGMALSF